MTRDERRRRAGQEARPVGWMVLAQITSAHACSRAYGETGWLEGEGIWVSVWFIARPEEPTGAP